METISIATQAVYTPPCLEARLFGKTDSVLKCVGKIVKRGEKLAGLR
jgi:hypothetical protein